MKFRYLCIVAAFGLAVSACSSQPSPSGTTVVSTTVPVANTSAMTVTTSPTATAPPAPAPLAGSEVVFSGAGSGEVDSWQTFDLKIANTSEVTTSLDWNSTGPSNLNVYLKTPDGASDYDKANGTVDKPEVAGATLDKGSYMVAVKIKAGTPQTRFTVSVDVNPVVAPTTTTPVPTTQAPPPSSPTLAFPGDVPAGYLRWGAAIGGNSDPVARHEAPAGTLMALRRTYFAWSHIASGYLERTVRSDIAAGRLPWVSLKTPGWSQIASGAYDGEIDSMLRMLDSAGGPVWLTIHHEPENDGLRAADWRAMQRKIRERMDAVGVKNIAFAPVLMSWTYDSRSGRNPDDWWVDGIWDFVGIDHYLEEQSATLGGTDDVLWQRTTSYLAGKDLPVALGEWANRGTDTATAAEMQAFYDKALRPGSWGIRMVGMAYFDSGLNSPLGSYELQGEPLTKFHQLMNAPTSLGLFESP